MANKLGWSHDGTTFTVASDDVVALQTPFSPAPAPGTMLVYLADGLWHSLPAGAVGQKLAVDSTGTVLEWQDVTPGNTTTIYQVVSSQPPPTPIVASCSDTCGGAALQMAASLVESYNVASSIIKATLNDIITLTTQFFNSDIVKLLSLLGGPEAVMGTEVMDLLVDLAAAILNEVVGVYLAPLSPQCIDNIQKATYDATIGACCPSGDFLMTTALQDAWVTTLAAHGGPFLPIPLTGLQPQLLLCKALIKFYQPQYWNTQITAGIVAPSSTPAVLSYF